MAIQSNFPAIRPSLLLDFANSKRLDPRITFTRASTARYYDGSTVAKAEENLLLQSQDYSATWTVTNLTPVTGKTAPDGTSTATEFTAGAANATLTQSVTAIAADYTFSVWLRRVTGTGNIDISAHSGGTWVTQSISGTWARYTVTQALTAGARTPGIRVVTSGDVIEVWGAQLEQRSAVTAYTATTTAPITNYVPQLLTAQNNVPRFDHTPTTGESLGLLIEESRTNLLLQSENFGTTWTNSNSSEQTDVIVAPDGTLTGDKLITNSGATGGYLTQSVTVTTATHTFSVYAKAGEVSLLRLYQGNTALANFELSTQTITLAAGGLSAQITAAGNGWYRCAVQVSLTAGTLAFRIYGRTSSEVGDGYGGIYIWGAQVELGGFATSYIPTTSATVTRNQDLFSMTGTNFSSWFNNSEGTLYAEMAAQVTGSSSDGLINFSDNTSNNYMHIRTGSASGINPNWFAITGGTNQVSIALSPATTDGSFFRVAGAYKVNDFAACKAGGTVGTDTNVTVPPVSQLTLGNVTGATARTQRVRKLAYYPLRLTNAQLQAITG